MKKQSVGLAICLTIVFLVVVAGAVFGDENTKPSSSAKDLERQKALEEALKATSSGEKESQSKKLFGEGAEKQKSLPGGTRAESQSLGEVNEGKSDGAIQAAGGTEVSDGEKEKAEGTKTQEKKAKEEKEKELPFLIIDNISWEAKNVSAALEMEGESEGPDGDVTFGDGGREAHWRPGKAMVVKKRKRNPVQGSVLQEVVFREDTLQTKKLGLEAPYYALEEILLRFSAPVTCKPTQDGKMLREEFSSQAKKAAIIPEVNEQPQKEVSLPVSERPTSPADILGSFYQAKSEYETYALGGAKVGETLAKLRSEKQRRQGVFDGKNGFPEDMGPVYQEAYPLFGTREYWKKHVRAALSQTFGYSSDYDGAYGTWGGFKTGKNAGTGKPDFAISYAHHGVADVSAGYEIQKTFPVGELVHFGDGPQNQTVSFGGGYFPKKRYSIYTENSMNFISGKNLQQTSSQGIFREKNASYRLTNAAGLNYRLTQKLQWQGGIGLERTWSYYPVSNKTHIARGYLNTGLSLVISKRTSVAMGYAYNNKLIDTGDDDNGSGGVSTTGGNGSIIDTKDKIQQSISAQIQHKLSKRLSWSGGLGEDILGGGGDIGKFGGQTTLNYQWTASDDVTFGYRNRVVNNDTAILTGRQMDTGTQGLRSTLSRDEVISFRYEHVLGQSGSVPKMSFLLSGEYHRQLPLSGVYGQQIDRNSGFSLETTLRRKLRRGLTWIELTYRFSTFLSKPGDEASGDKVAVKENAVLLTVSNYFGEWEERT